jgi:hypothetical protein
MAKKDTRKEKAAPDRSARRDPVDAADDRVDVPTLLWALGILAVLIVLQRLIWGE